MLMSQLKFELFESVSPFTQAIMLYIVVFRHIVCMRACMCVCMRVCVCGVSKSQQPSSGSSSHRVLFTSNQCFPTDLINSKNNQLCMETDPRCDYWLLSSDLHRRRLPRLSSQSNGQHWHTGTTDWYSLSLYFWAVGAACMDSKDTYMQMHKVIQPIHGSSLWTCKICTLGLSCTRPPNNQEKKKKKAGLLTMTMHFSSAVAASPRAIYTEISMPKMALHNSCHGPCCSYH